MATVESMVAIAHSVDTQSDTEVRSRPRTRTLALAGVIGPIWFTTLVVLQGCLVPDYSHVRLPISALAAWPTGWIQNVNFYVAGVLTMAFAVALHHGVKPTRRGGAGVALLVLGGLGLVWAGIFPWTMVDGVPTETAPHVIGAVTVCYRGRGDDPRSRGQNEPRRESSANYCTTNCTIGSGDGGSLKSLANSIR